MNYEEFKKTFPDEQLSEQEIAELNQHGKPELLLRGGEPFNVDEARRFYESKLHQ